MVFTDGALRRSTLRYICVETHVGVMMDDSKGLKEFFIYVIFARVVEIIKEVKQRRRRVKLQVSITRDLELSER